MGNLEKLEEMVRLAAYYRYLGRTRSGEAGSELGDWLAAEKEITSANLVPLATKRGEAMPEVARINERERKSCVTPSARELPLQRSTHKVAVGESIVVASREPVVAMAKKNQNVQVKAVVAKLSTKGLAKKPATEASKTSVAKSVKKVAKKATKKSVVAKKAVAKKAKAVPAKAKVVKKAVTKKAVAKKKSVVKKKAAVVKKKTAAKKKVKRS